MDPMQRIEQDIEQARVKFDQWKETHTRELLAAEEKAGKDATENEGEHSPGAGQTPHPCCSLNFTSRSITRLPPSFCRDDQEAVQGGAGPAEECENFAL